jgi:beta-hydroxylase
LSAQPAAPTHGAGFVFLPLCLHAFRSSGQNAGTAAAPPRSLEENVLNSAVKHDLVTQLQEKARDEARSMFFFKWYGANLDTTLKVPAFHEDYKYVKTIGVSVFNKKEWTSKHFGYTRASLRVLYNLNDFDDASAYIQVGGTTNYWFDNKLFIFDDTLLHQSVNDSDKSRYCMFIDIVRPSPLPAVLGLVVFLFRTISGRFNAVFYQRWKIIRP